MAVTETNTTGNILTGVGMTNHQIPAVVAAVEAVPTAPVPQGVLPGKMIQLFTIGADLVALDGIAMDETVTPAGGIITVVIGVEAEVVAGRCRLITTRILVLPITIIRIVHLTVVTSETVVVIERGR